MRPSLFSEAFFTSGRGRGGANQSRLVPRSPPSPSAATLIYVPYIKRVFRVPLWIFRREAFYIRTGPIRPTPRRTDLVAGYLLRCFDCRNVISHKKWSPSPFMPHVPGPRCFVSRRSELYAPIFGRCSNITTSRSVFTEAYYCFHYITCSTPDAGERETSSIV